jgi:hypothetical protein
MVRPWRRPESLNMILSWFCANGHDLLASKLCARHNTRRLSLIESGQQRAVASSLASTAYFLPFGSIRVAVDGGTMPLERRYPTMFP